VTWSCFLRSNKKPLHVSFCAGHRIGKIAFHSIFISSTRGANLPCYDLFTMTPIPRHVVGIQALFVVNCVKNSKPLHLN